MKPSFWIPTGHNGTGYLTGAASTRIWMSCAVFYTECPHFPPYLTGRLQESFPFAFHEVKPLSLFVKEIHSKNSPETLLIDNCITSERMISNQKNGKPHFSGLPIFGHLEQLQFLKQNYQVVLLHLENLSII
jgi:hypothetical protein